MKLLHQHSQVCRQPSSVVDDVVDVEVEDVVVDCVDVLEVVVVEDVEVVSEVVELLVEDVYVEVVDEVVVCEVVVCELVFEVVEFVVVSSPPLQAERIGITKRRTDIANPKITLFISILH